MLEDARVASLEAHTGCETESSMEFLAPICRELASEHGNECVECLMTVTRTFGDNWDECVRSFVTDRGSVFGRFHL